MIAKIVPTTSIDFVFNKYILTYMSGTLISKIHIASHIIMLRMLAAEILVMPIIRKSGGLPPPHYIAQFFLNLHSNKHGVPPPPLLLGHVKIMN